MESRIQDCPGFPYMGRKVFKEEKGQTPATGLVFLRKVFKMSVKTKEIFFFLKTDTLEYTCIKLNHCIMKYKFYDFIIIK